MITLTKEKNIHAMTLHQTISINDDTRVTRVPGGWVYEVTNAFNGLAAAGYQSAVTFVPYSDEFAGDIH